MKIVEGKCASKYCEVISAETLLDLSDALSGESTTEFEAPMMEPKRIDRLTRFAPGAGMMEPEANQTPLKILTDLDVPEINNVIVTRSRQVWVNEVDDE